MTRMWMWPSIASGRSPSMSGIAPATLSTMWIRLSRISSTGCQANKISIHGNLYFIPNPYLQKLNMLEDYIDAISQYNLGGGLVMSNSMFVVDDDRQRQKMTEEFYINYKRDIEQYKERIQHFIDNGCTSPTVISRWLLKLKALQEKKNTYEEILKRKLDDLNNDYAMLQMQSEELRVRSLQGQMKLAA